MKVTTMQENRRDTDGDEGLAFLIVVVVLVAVMVVLATTLFRVALHNNTTASRMVGQGQALQAAEAGIDMAYQAIEAVTLASETVAKHKVPCGPLTGTLGSTPGRSTYTVTMTYYKYKTATNPSATTLATASCTTTSPLKVVRVKLTATGNNFGQTVKVTSRANVAPVNAFASSIFVNGSLTISGSNSSISGNPVYVHTGTLTCRGGGKTFASVLVFGKVTAGGNCWIGGVLEATKTISISGSAHLGGTVISTTGKITATGGSISGSLFAKGTITVATKSAFTTTHTVTGSTVRYTINATDSALVPPVKQPWPDLTWTTMTWSKLKYKTYTPGSTCTAAKVDIQKANSAATAGYVGIAVQTSCPISIKTLSLNLAQSLAVFTSAGVTFEKNASVADSSSAHHTLFLVVPTGSSCSGGNGGITIHGSVATGISTLIYSPCTVTVQGTSTIPSGEIYAKTLTMNGNLTLGTATFSIYTTSSTEISLGIDYERQITCPPTYHHCNA